MFSFFDQVPTSTSLLMQCGYRSKVCTNYRATKLDGTLHKLCEFHRRKANLNQQRLHKRQREQRAARHMYEPVAGRPAKKARPSLEPVIFPFKHEFEMHEDSEYTPLAGVSLPKIGAPDMDFLEWLLVDMQSLPPLETFLPSTLVSAEDSSSVIV
ncbi:hypothetical protein PHYPSEUDO_014876 [Phytophthora pseudosyringae]|uniref:Uncharacterized protein n=1 Tax=Phytophthora pseudosyringae TaxID=221518 RepID=A0A8T1W494_9STRA|nr:hypothetical protein PHYPSEUDO_014876 [Phytophthora pseudosyringae]